MDWELIVCFEVHVELATATKLFCGCRIGTGLAANSLICPICTGQPGTLPTLNKKAVELAVRAGMALNCSINEVSRFARKNYFYPDLPKGYQISQYETPFCENGFLEIEGDGGLMRKIGIRRIHLEEDAGKLVHSSGSLEGSENSFVDFNRSGVPLLEIVADHNREPISSTTEARRYLERLRQVLIDIGISECAIEKGQFRCDVNVSVRRNGEKAFRPRTEIKNIGSFRFINEAIEYEKQRQIELAIKGAPCFQETRLFDEARRITIPMRGKENAPDYRYFPDPDLVEVTLGNDFLDSVRRNMPDLIQGRLSELTCDYGLSEDDAGLIAKDRRLFEYFVRASARIVNRKKLAGWITRDLFSLLKTAALDISASPVSPEKLSELVSLMEHGELTETMGRAVLKEMFQTSRAATEIIEKKSMTPITDIEALISVVQKVIAQNPDAVDTVRSGKKETINFLVGQAMRLTSGRADAREVRDILIKIIFP
ncbi:MAG: Asp-tRNA(Asn)/Glu-tRNA(Gln) amidotransferase subunit GatB [Desulfobacteraceae bacterium]|nr:MAG: Asp-tRNA(Asn)/Glu-tRNA(Gln) amidotransferase subunit GatB [Desulfobacteraceae bacterium]